MKTPPDKLRLLMKKMTKRMLDAFVKSITNLRTDAQMRELERAIKAGDILRVYDALGLSPATYSGLEPVIREAFLQGGEYSLESVRKTSSSLGPGRVVLRFDGRHDQAEAWVRRHSSTLIREITDETREVIRKAVEDGIQAGRGPRSVALELVGRINPATGRRTGGVIGLTRYQQSLVERARAELLSGDSAQLRSYLDRKRRDGRLDSAVRKALAGEHKLTSAEVDRMVGRYQDGLLKYRGEVIARTEALSSLNAGREEGIRQLVASGKIRENQVEKIWRATGDNRTRDTHAMINGQTVGLNEPFVTSAGHRLMFPQDRSLGAPASETIQCRCFYELRIKYFS